LIEKHKRKDPQQNKTQTKQKQNTKTHLPLISSPLLSCCLLMLVFLSSLSSSIALESRLITNALNKIVTGLPTKLFYIEMELEPFFLFPKSPQLQKNSLCFYSSLFVNYSLFPFFCATLTIDCKKTMVIVVAKLLSPLPLRPKL